MVIVPNCCKNVSMRVMNVAGCPVTLPDGVLLADLEALGMVGDSTELTVWKGVERETEADVLARGWTESIPQYWPRSETLWAICLDGSRRPLLRARMNLAGRVR